MDLDIPQIPVRRSSIVVTSSSSGGGGGASSSSPPPFFSESLRNNGPKFLMHTVPVFESATISIVLQFSCIVKEEHRVCGDDGTFSPNNRTHRIILDRLMHFVLARINDTYPLSERMRNLR